MGFHVKKKSGVCWWGESHKCKEQRHIHKDCSFFRGWLGMARVTLAALSHLDFLWLQVTENSIRCGLLFYTTEKSRDRAGFTEAKPPKDLALSVSPVATVAAPDSTPSHLQLWALSPGLTFLILTPHQVWSQDRETLLIFYISSVIVISHWPIREESEKDWN